MSGDKRSEVVQFGCSSPCRKAGGCKIPLTFYFSDWGVSWSVKGQWNKIKKVVYMTTSMGVRRHRYIPKQNIATRVR